MGAKIVQQKLRRFGEVHKAKTSTAKKQLSQEQQIKIVANKEILHRMFFEKVTRNKTVNIFQNKRGKHIKIKGK